MSDFVNIKIASDEDFSEVKKLRESIFVKEQNVPSQAEFNNDGCATHILAYVNNKAIGTMRMRFFHDFVQLERACVVQEFRKTNVAKLIMNTAFKYCAAKGYNQVKWYCELALVPYWMKTGAHWTGDVFQLANMTLTTMIRDLPKTKQQITINTPPEILNRKEGEWFDDEQIFGSFPLETKEQITRFNTLSKKLNFLKSKETAVRPPLKENLQKRKSWHPPLKDDLQTR